MKRNQKILSSFYIAIEDFFETVVQHPAMVSLAQFSEYLLETLEEYSEYPMTGNIWTMYIEDIFGNYATVSLDSGYLIAWINDDADYFDEESLN